MDFPLPSPTAVTNSGLLLASSGAESSAGLDHRAMETIRSLDRYVRPLNPTDTPQKSCGRACFLKQLARWLGGDALLGQVPLSEN